MQFSVFQESHIGGRKVSHDQMGYSFTCDALLLILTDGMGGHLHGEIAANIALQPLVRCFRKMPSRISKNQNVFWKTASSRHI